MSETSVRVLNEDDWRDYRAVRRAALQESPKLSSPPRLRKRRSPSSTGETAWCEPIGCSQSVTERRSATSLARPPVSPRTCRSSTRCGGQVCPRDDTELDLLNPDVAVSGGGHAEGAAIGFAINAGFRLTSERRTTPIKYSDFGDQEIALVLSLANDPAAVATSTPSRLTSKPGPHRPSTGAHTGNAG